MLDQILVHLIVQTTCTHCCNTATDPRPLLLLARTHAGVTYTISGVYVIYIRGTCYVSCLCFGPDKVLYLNMCLLTNSFRNLRVVLGIAA